MYAFFTRIGAQIWNSIPYSIKILKRSSFRKKKLQELLLNFLRSEDDYVEVSRTIQYKFYGQLPMGAFQRQILIVQVIKKTNKTNTQELSINNY